MSDPVKAFWAKVDKSGECWLWTAARSKRGGYGSLRIGGRGMVAHRFSWELHNGPIPGGMFVCHNCPGGDNKACVNPAHLWLGTNAQNIQDAYNKGLVPATSAKTHCKRGHPLSGDNLRMNSAGHRLCVQCRRYLSREWFRRNPRRAALHTDTP